MRGWSSLQRLEQLFGTGESGLGYQSGQLLNAFVDVASRPQDAASRQVAIARAGDLAASFQCRGRPDSNLQAGVRADLQTSIKAVNALAKTVAGLNQQIATAVATGHTPNDLLDQRDQAVTDIGKYVQVTTIAAGDGSLNLFIGGGQRLVLGSDASSLVAMADPFDSTQVHVGISEGGKSRLVPDSMIAGGSIAGLLRFQNEDLRDARNLVGQMAAALGGAVNAQQRLGLDLTSPERPAGAGSVRDRRAARADGDDQRRQCGRRDRRGRCHAAAGKRLRIAIRRQRLHADAPREHGRAADVHARCARRRRDGRRHEHPACERQRSCGRPLPAAAGGCGGEQHAARVRRSARHRRGLAGHGDARRQRTPARRRSPRSTSSRR